MKSDVIIAGGGLAGLGLAKQLKLTNAELDIVIVEKNAFPRPRAIAKVGESTVEIGSHYLSKHLQLKSHLQEKHLKKFGIRVFFGESTSDLSNQDELGVSQVFGIPTYQIDRGDIENHLATEVQSMGVKLIDQADIIAIDTGAAKQLTIKTDGEQKTLSSRWLIDTAGRASLIKNHLQLGAKNSHKAHAIWFRIDKKIIIDDWSSNTDWRARCMPKGHRWLSTNHLVGAGYWVWVIPLASGVTSIGIVMDEQAFMSSNIHNPQSAMKWLFNNQRRCAEAIGNATFLDFVVLRDYSYDCKQLFSDQGWGISGEAGVFADPFYSPGSDFIAFANGFITSLITDQKKGQDIRLNTLVFEKILKSIYQNTLSLYVNQYGGFGDRAMMSLKLLWDYTYYWGVLSLLYFRDALCNFNRIRPVAAELQKAQDLNQQIQSLFRERASQRLVLPNRGIFIDQYQIPCLRYFNKILMQDPQTDIATELKQNMQMMNQIAVAVTNMLSDNPDKTPSDAERELLGDYRMSVLG